MAKKIEIFFRQHPVFTKKTFVLAMQDAGAANPNTLKNMLDQHLKQGHIVRIKPGLFASIPRGAEPGTYPINPFWVTGLLTEDAVVGYHSALALYGVAYSSSYKFIYLTRHKPKGFTFRGDVYQPTFYPVALERQKKQDCYVRNADVQGVNVKVTTKERTLVDVMDRPILGGGWEEIWRSLDMLTHFQVEHIVNYALMLNNATTIAKIGFYLEERQSELKIEERHLKILLRHAPKLTHYMDKACKAKSRYVKHWNLMVPIALLNRDWEENLGWSDEE